MGRIFMLIFLIAALASACASAPQAAATPTESPTLEPTATNTALPEPTPLPSVLELTRATDPSQQAFLSVIHAAAGMPVFDVYVERLAVASNISFGQSTQPSGIVAGEYFLRVVPNGVRPDASQFLYETQLGLKGGDSLLLIFTTAPDGLVMSIFQQPLEPLQSDQSRVTAIHAVPNGPEITLQQSGTSISVPMSFGNAAFPVILPPGETTLGFQASGTAPTTYTMNLQERFSYVLVLAGTIDNMTVIETRNSVPGLASVRAVNASATVGPVDVYLNGKLLAGELAYTRASDHQIHVAQQYTVDIFPTGADPTSIEPLFSTQLVANNDDYITLILEGEPQDLRLLPYREDRSLTAPNRARIAVINALPQVPRARIDLQDRTFTEVGELSYGNLPSVVDLTAGTYRFAWIRMEDGSPAELVEVAENVQLEPGRSYLYLLTGRINDPPVVLSDNIGFDQNLVGFSEDVQPTPTLEVPTRVRFINAVKGSAPLDVFLNGQALATTLVYGASSTPAIFGPGTHRLEVRPTGSAQSLYSSGEIILEPSTPYTIVISGFGTNPVESLLLDDSQVDLADSSPHVRLINTTIFGELTLALGESSTQGIANTSTIIGEPAGSDMHRRSMSYGIEPIRTLEETAGRASSNVSLAPLGPHDLHLIDVGLNMIALSIRQVDFRPGAHYDVIAYQNQDSALVEGFAVLYPGG
jgi:hypothetical protein